MSKIYSVSCDCPTPLAANPFKVLAESEDDAVSKFKLRNGIAATDHAIKAVEAVDGEDGEGNKEGDNKPTEKGQIKAYLAEHPQATNKEVVEALAALGTVVTSSQVTAARKDV